MATKFVSALTGPEMDQALIDMAYHNSEAYAVGTRNGVPVGSSDVTYHNNSKYYAEQAYGYTDRAEDAAARAEAAVPAGTAGAVFFDRAQSLTTAQQSQARANIMAGGSNDNLLDNWYFVGGGSQLGDGIFPINQRGQTSYNGGITGFDRWTVDGGDFTATLESGGVRVTSTTPYAGLSQILPAYKLQNGETYTYSIVVDGVLHTKTFVANNDGNWANIYYGPDWYVPYQFINGKWTFKIINTSLSTGMNHLVSKVKLEKGTVSTLANDAPPDFVEELAKCQHYLYAVTFPGHSYTGQICFALDATNINWSITTPTPMVQAKLPSITVTNSLYANGVAISNYAIVNYPYGNNIKVSAQAGGLTNGQLYPITTSASEVKVLISTEL